MNLRAIVDAYTFPDNDDIYYNLRTKFITRARRTAQKVDMHQLINNVKPIHVIYI